MKKVIALLLAAMMVIGLAACGQTPAPAGDEPQQEVQGSDEPVIFRYGLFNDWMDSKNPYSSSWAISTTVYHSNHYEYLVRLNPALEQEGFLAESWSVSEDGMTWTINVRQGVQWTDGEALTADDVVFSYKAVLENELPRFYSEISSITDIVAVDEYTVELTTSVPRADYINMFIMPIVPEHIWNVNETQEDFMNFFDPNLIGTGPFIFVDESVDEFVRYKANDNYWGGRPNIDELIYVFFANDDIKMQALAAGEIDITTITAAQFDSVSAMEGIETVEYGTLSFTEMGFNMWQDEASKGNPLIRDVKEIRQAIDYAINYDELIEFAKGGFANHEYGLIPSLAKPYAWTPDADTMRGFDPQKGIELLESAGFTTVDGDGIRSNDAGEKLSFRASVIEGSYRDAALLIQGYCKDIGINLDITFVDSARQSDIIYEQDFDTDIYFWGWTGDYEDPGYILSIMTTEQVGGRSDCFYSNPAYDELFNAQISMVDQEERIAAVTEMQEIIYEDCPYLLLYSNANVLAYNGENWEGFIRQPAEFGSILTMRSLANVSHK
ncbi:MAG: ABC transporter substrate-binding protein [Clostridiales bacterium]|jgi:peptide/nickel transport system substrate-binding protein|nr:ABC transporter substrate-binding protein [Clostridiales bacterium]